MIRTLTIAALAIVAAIILTACGGEASPPDDCMLSWQGQSVPCQQADAASAVSK